MKEEVALCKVIRHQFGFNYPAFTRKSQIGCNQDRIRTNNNVKHFDVWLNANYGA